MGLTKPIRIAFCHYSSDVGGGSDQALFELVTHLPPEKFEAALILRSGDPMAKTYRDGGYRVAEVPLVSPRRTLNPFKFLHFLIYFLPSVLLVAWNIRKFRSDVVHVNTLFNLQGACASRLAGCPLVWHIRELAAESFLFRVMLRFPPVLAFRAVANSNAVGTVLENCGDRLRVVLNGLDLELYQGIDGVDRPAVRQEFDLDATAKVIAVIGRLEAWKGQHVLFAAMPKIVASVDNVQLLVAGAVAVNKPEYETHLKTLSHDLDIADHIKFAGYQESVMKLLAISDLVVLPTETAEPFGRSLVEAMACSLPVVATAAGGPLDIVVDGETGWLVPPGDSEALAEKICRLLSNPEEAKRMGTAGHVRAHEKFSLPRLVGEMESLFTEAVLPKAHTSRKRS